MTTPTSTGEVPPAAGQRSAPDDAPPSALQQIADRVFATMPDLTEGEARLATAILQVAAEWVPALAADISQRTVAHLVISPQVMDKMRSEAREEAADIVKILLANARADVLTEAQVRDIARSAAAELHRGPIVKKVQRDQYGDITGIVEEPAR